MIAGMHPMQALRRHPLPMECRFRVSLVVAYAFDAEPLRRMLPAPITIDTHTDQDGREWGFAACAMVALDGLRVTGAPRWMGSSSIMAGYRIFARMRNHRGQTMRGLRILRSDVDRPLQAWGANLVTRYGYHHTRAELVDAGDRVRFVFDTEDGTADVDVTADLSTRDVLPPSGSPFAPAREARRFAGPLPYTFSSDPEGVVVVKSDRAGWTPRSVAAEVEACTFFDRGPFADLERRFANAFVLTDVDYGWRAGRLVRTEELVA